MDDKDRGVRENAHVRVGSGYSTWAAAQENLQAVREVFSHYGVEYAVLPARAPHFPLLIVPEEQGKKAASALLSLAEGDGWSFRVLFPGGESVRLPERGIRPRSPIPISLYAVRGVKSLDGTPLNTRYDAVTVEIWQRLPSGVARLDGGEYLEGTLQAAPEHRRAVISYIEPPQWRDIESQSNRTVDIGGPLMEDVSGPIDAVYTWVDGEDFEWLRRKAEALGEKPPEGINEASYASSRFASRDELRFSLRSLELYAGWINHVYLVTDQQVPGWLRQDHPNLTVVDHKEIFSDLGALPVYNSHAIESQLHRIPGLSDRYLYMNDDVFFSRPTTPELFFTSNGLSKFFLSKAVLDISPPSERDVAVMSAAKRNRALLQKLHGRSVTQKFKHTPHPQNKEVVLDLEKTVPEIFEQVMRSRLRHPDDYSISSALHHYHAYFTGQAIPGKIRYDYIDIGSESAYERLKETLKREDLDVFCLNDVSGGQGTEDYVQAILHGFLFKKFPIKSSYEK